MVVTFFLVLLFPFCISSYSIRPNQSITDGYTLISQGKVFELGFFSPGNSRYRYLGIWYVKVPGPTVVWVANRDNPINDSSGSLSIDSFGNLVLHNNDKDRNIWSTNIVSVQSNTTALLLDSGNLVLVQDNDTKVVWQSFDYPTDTMLSGMKVGIDRKTNFERFLTSWKSKDDPRIGNYSLKVNPSGSPQVFLYNGSTQYWRTIPWPWISKSQMKPTPTYIYNNTFVNNQDEIYFTYRVEGDTSIITILVVDDSGSLRRLTWQDGEHRWEEFTSVPKYRCDYYGHCGAYSTCKDSIDTLIFECTCLPGYEPKSPGDWYLRDRSGGCKRKRAESSLCGNGEGFVKLRNVKIPDSSNAAWVDMGFSRTDCEQACLKNCSCMAFAILDVDVKGRGCLAWYGQLTDTSIMGEKDWGRDLYIRVDAIELAENVSKKGFLENKKMLAIPIVFAALALFFIILFTRSRLMKKRKIEGTRKLPDFSGSSTSSRNALVVNELEESGTHPNLPFFNLSNIIAATENFSPANKLGQGGFGPVYKGQLSNGQDIAVKRLSNNSGQGIEEFTNEVKLIAKLQHRNLVKLLGCCIQGDEKMLIYEYMPNGSLNSFIFDQTRRSFLEWRKCFEIIVGIARGILYLHQDSRLRIIHRDLKSSNILLDAELNPKISDFGMARIFKGDQIQDMTHRVVGTYGYMAPEYVAFGKFSIKSDVYSFGVILLEIISGKKINGSCQDDSFLNLIRHVWDLWREDRALEIVDSSLKESCLSQEVIRCIQIGLLCVQDDATDRPTMLSVVLMLNSEISLPFPKQPAFIFRTCNDHVSPIVESGCSINEVLSTTFEAR